MNCRSCRFAEGDLVGNENILWCWLHSRVALEVCDRFEREPGADDDLNTGRDDDLGNAAEAPGTHEKA